MAADAPRVSRRRALLAASASAGAALVLGGCGSSGPGAPTVPEDNAADADVLNGLLGVCNVAADACTFASAHLHGAHGELVRRIGAQEAAHVYTLYSEIDRLGGIPAPAAAPAHPGAPPGPPALVGLVASTGQVVIAASIDALAKIGDLQARGAVLSIATNEAQHAALLAQARGLPALPASAIVRGTA